MLGIGAGALGIGIAAKVAQAVADVPQPPKTEVEPNDPPREEPPRTPDIDWELLVKKQDFIRESPPIVPQGAFEEYEWKHQYINSDLRIEYNKEDFDTIQIPVDTADDRMDAFYQVMTMTDGTGTPWGRNE